MRLQSCSGWEFIPIGLGWDDLIVGRLNPLLLGEESLGSKVIDRGIRPDPTIYLLWWDQGFSIIDQKSVVRMLEGLFTVIVAD
jgi:hypothetical protein